MVPRKLSRILITGGAGFIGSNLIKQLKELNHEISCLDNYSTGSKKNEVNGVRYIDDDICNIDKLGKEFDICFHLAAQSRVQPSFENPNESFRVNVSGTTKVLEWARKNKIKIIYAGSSSKHHDPSDSPYAMYKFLGEEVCKLYKKSFDVNVEIARFYNVYGPGESVDEKYGNVIGIWITKIKKGESIPIVGDGCQKRDFIHVCDIVDGLIKIAFSDLKHKDAWELGTGNNYSINELFMMFKDRFNTSSYYIPDQPGNYKFTLRDNDDTIKLLNWTPQDRLKDHINSLKIK